MIFLVFMPVLRALRSPPAASPGLVKFTQVKQISMRKDYTPLNIYFVVNTSVPFRFPTDIPSV